MMLLDTLSRAAEKFRKGGILAVFASLSNRAYFLKLIWRKYLMSYIRKNYGHVIAKYKNYTPPPR